MSRLIRRARGTTRALFELAVGLTRSGRLWLVPLVGVMALCALLLAVVTVLEYAAPFVYTIF